VSLLVGWGPKRDFFYSLVCGIGNSIVRASFMTAAVGHVFTFDEILSGYRKEAEGLAVISNAGFLAKCMPIFKDYPEYMRALRHDKSVKNATAKLIDGNGVIDVKKRAPESKEFFYFAHLATCCSLFNGWELSPRDLTKEKLDAYVISAANKSVRDNAGSLWFLEDALQRADTVRVVNLLRGMGLLMFQSESCCQLSLGAGSGSRDLDAMHGIPEIRLVEKKGSAMWGGERAQSLVLKLVAAYPQAAVLIDADPGFAKHYQRLNENGSLPFRIMALNEKLDDALNLMPDKLNESGMSRFNMIVGFRIDHCMIPDVAAFFKQLVPVMAELADFVVTIGAGHGLNEFIGREEKIEEIHAYLKRKGLSPVRVRMSYGNTPEERRNNQAFGLNPIASYEILYCKLKRKLLTR